MALNLNLAEPLPETDVFKASLDYFEGDELATQVWMNKYALKDSNGVFYDLTPDDMHRRIASEIARIESRYPNPISENEIFDLLKKFRYIIPQGSPATGIGNPFQIASLSNCFVIGPGNSPDSYGGILQVDQEQVQLMKRRGGVGHDLSHIRPKGTSINNSALISPGVAHFMERYSNSTREVIQNGRRGALMLSVSIKHPDAESFIDAKLTKNKVTGANVSVRIDDKFMHAVENNDTYLQQYPIDSASPTYQNKIEAVQIWKKIIHNAWHSAEPGILFWDTIKRESIPDCYTDLGYESVCTNSCGEIPLERYGSCRLLCINLFSYVENPYLTNSIFNWSLFKNHIALAQRMLDDIVDLELEKIDSILRKIDKDSDDERVKLTERNLWANIRTKVKDGRRIGISTTGEGDMLAALGLRYGSEEGISFSVEIHKVIALEAYRGSVQIARQRGAFPIYESKREINNPFIQRIKKEDHGLYKDMLKYGRRNIALLTIAPTGTTSIMTRTTSGIEPVFLPVYKRRRKVNPFETNLRIDSIDELGDRWQEYRVFHYRFKQWMCANGYDVDKSYSDVELQDIIKESPYHKATSGDVDYLKKVKMQGAIQKWVDHSISVTINIPSHATQELVGECYLEAWKAGCKGVTVYRDGSRSGVLVSSDSKKIDPETTNVKAFPKVRPQKLTAELIHFAQRETKWIVIIGFINCRPYEFFVGLACDQSGYNQIPRCITDGQLIKDEDAVGGYRYNFQYSTSVDGKIVTEELGLRANPECRKYNQLISSALQNEIDLQKTIDLIDSLEAQESDTIWESGIVHVLDRYISKI